MRRSEAKNERHVIVVSGENTPRNQRHELFDAYHDSRYIVSHDRRKIVSLTEKGENRVYRLVNDAIHELVVMRVDGGIFSDSKNTKCDYGIYTHERILVLVELKGADYSHALEQLDTTVDEMIARPQLHVGKLYGRVVLSKTRIPNTLTSKEMALKRKLKRYNGSLAKATKLIEERISAL